MASSDSTVAEHSTDNRTIEGSKFAAGVVRVQMTKMLTSQSIFTQAVNTHVLDMAECDTKVWVYQQLNGTKCFKNVSNFWGGKIAFFGDI
jgi:hypothetical protein